MKSEEKYEVCPFCSEKFTENDRIPIWIACGHILCRPCLNLINIEVGQIVCPLCKPARDYANGAIHGKIDIRPIEELTPHSDSLKYIVAKSQAICSSHNSPAVSFCLEDIKFVCNLCKSSHEVHELSDNLLKIHSRLSKNLYKSPHSNLQSLKNSQLRYAKKISETKNKLNEKMTKLQEILASLEITAGNIKLPVSTLCELVIRFKSLSNPSQLSVKEKIEYLKYLKLLKADPKAITQKLEKIKLFTSNALK